MFTLVIVAGLLRAVIKRVMIFFSYFYSLGVLVFLEWEVGRLCSVCRAGA